METLLRRRGYKRFPIFLIALFTFLFSFIYLVEVSLSETIYTFAEAHARWTATEIINKAISEKVVPNVSYTDLIKPERNIQNEIVFLQINMSKVNQITSEAILEIQKSLEQLNNEKYKIPLGQVLGLKLLANVGPKFTLTLLPLGTVEAKISDDFQDAGINQTRHRIYLTVKSTVKVVIPLVNEAIPVETKVPLADAIIVGRVPNTYFNFGKQLNAEDIINKGFQQ